jgi:hypothetical protein
MLPARGAHGLDPRIGAASPPPPPRPVGAVNVGFAPGFLLLFGGIWAFVGLVLCCVFTLVGGPVWDDVLLDQHGVRAMVTPLRSVRTSSRVNRAWVYEVSWRATDASAAPREGTVRTLGDRRSPFEIEYDPDRPELAREVGGRASFFGWFVLIPFAAFVVGSCLVMIGTVVRARRRALYRDGAAAQAEVVSFQPTSMRVNNQPVFRVTYRYSTPAGMRTASSNSARPYRPGSPLWVIYDPSQPERTMLA